MTKRRWRSRPGGRAHLRRAPRCGRRGWGRRWRYRGTGSIFGSRPRARRSGMAYPLVSCLGRSPSAALLVLLAAATGARLIASDFLGARYGSIGPSSNSPAAASASSSARRLEASLPKRAHHDVALATSSIGGWRSFMRSRSAPRGDASTSSSSERPITCGSMNPSSYARRRSGKTARASMSALSAASAPHT